MCQNRLTSIDYAKFILLQAANNNHRIKNMMQLQNILLYIYGILLADTKTPLFEEKPQGWAFGVVFPKVFDEVLVSNIESVDETKVPLFKRDTETTIRIAKLATALAKINAEELDDWFHGEDSLWGQYIYRHTNLIQRNSKVDWGMNVDRSDIANFFSQANNRIYGE